MKRLLLSTALALAVASPANAARICSQSRKCVNVAPSAAKALQCVIHYVEQAGVRIVAMRGYGHGTVHGSQHPAGRALDINQTGRGRFGRNPRVPGHVADAAADHCGVISGNRWANNDNGHWNLGHSARRTVAKKE